MKVKIICKKENYPVYEGMLTQGGFEVTEDSTLTLYENACFQEYILSSGEEMEMVDVDDILYIQSSGRDILIYTADKVLTTKDKLYELERNLPIDRFIRVSNYSIVNRKYINKINPTLGMKFYLEMSGGNLVDVTRSYYYKFKEYIGF